MKYPQAQINLAALQHNLQVVKACAPKQKVLAMIKANGYGHGAVRVAQALQQADGLAVASLEEAMTLRDADIQKPIMLTTGIATAAELMTAAENEQIVVHHNSHLELLNKTKLKNPIKIWLKIDTGMHRLGFSPEKFPDMYQQLKACVNVHPNFILMTHFADSDIPSKSTTAKQAAIFQALTANLAEEKSLANSGAILAHPETHADWIRPGIMLYGASPIANTIAPEFNLKPVMTLTAKLIAINNIKAGEKIGYGGTYTCQEDMPVGVIAIGYGDGYPRHIKNGTPVLINGVRCPIAGHLSMDMITVDLRNCPNAQVNDIVTLWGEGLPAEIAGYADTISYTLFCGVTERVRFCY